jgi:DNA-binding NtrC family response regulator
MAQVKLLRLLQEREFRPLGSRKTYKVDIRVVAASNANLEESLHSGRFRKDLYYRLNVIPLHLPPLRARLEDIPLLARHFEAKHAAGLGRPQREIAPGALQRLMAYEWPGNVRELENVIERAVVLCNHAVIGPEDLLLPAPHLSFRASRGTRREHFSCSQSGEKESSRFLGIASQKQAHCFGDTTARLSLGFFLKGFNSLRLAKIG